MDAVSFGGDRGEIWDGSGTKSFNGFSGALPIPNIFKISSEFFAVVFRLGHAAAEPAAECRKNNE